MKTVLQWTTSGVRAAPSAAPAVSKRCPWRTGLAARARRMQLRCLAVNAVTYIYDHIGLNVKAWIPEKAI